MMHSYEALSPKTDTRNWSQAQSHSAGNFQDPGQGRACFRPSVKTSAGAQLTGMLGVEVRVWKRQLPELPSLAPLRSRVISDQGPRP